MGKVPVCLLWQLFWLPRSGDTLCRISGVDLVDTFDCLSAGFVQLCAGTGFCQNLARQYASIVPLRAFYQRLVADEVNDAMQVANDYICAQLPKKPSAEEVARRVQMFYGEVAIPAIRIYSQGHDSDVTAEHRLRLYQGLQFFNHAFQKAYRAN